jgi:hypothetical protein
MEEIVLVKKLFEYTESQFLLEKIYGFFAYLNLLIKSSSLSSSSIWYESNNLDYRVAFKIEDKFFIKT